MGLYRSSADGAARGFFVRGRQNCEPQTIEWVIHGGSLTEWKLRQPFSFAESKVKIHVVEDAERKWAPQRSRGGGATP